MTVALDSAATLVVNTGHFYTAVVDTALPDDLSAPGVTWKEVGHTSLSDIFGISSNGGDRNVLGSLQNVSLRTKYSTRTETFTFTVQQFDEDSLKLYYGSNAGVDVTSGAIQVPQNPVPTTAAFLAVFYDGVNRFAFHAPKADILRNDDMSLSDTESLAGLPLGVTPLASGTNTYTYQVTPLGA
jgi:hypothetical protein